MLSSNKNFNKIKSKIHPFTLGELYDILSSRIAGESLASVAGRYGVSREIIRKVESHMMNEYDKDIEHLNKLKEKLNG